MKNIALILTSIIMGAVGQILLKAGVNRMDNISLSISGIISIIKNSFILIGLVLFGTSFILWLKVLAKNNLSYVYPMVSLSYVIIVIASRVFFNEALTINKIIGITAIIFGVFIINK